MYKCLHGKTATDLSASKHTAHLVASSNLSLSSSFSLVTVLSLSSASSRALCTASSTPLRHPRSGGGRGADAGDGGCVEAADGKKAGASGFSPRAGGRTGQVGGGRRGGRGAKGMAWGKGGGGHCLRIAERAFLWYVMSNSCEGPSSKDPLTNLRTGTRICHSPLTRDSDERLERRKISTCCAPHRSRSLSFTSTSSCCISGISSLLSPHVKGVSFSTSLICTCMYVMVLRGPIASSRPSTSSALPLTCNFCSLGIAFASHPPASHMRSPT
mmetsp:Transcript_40148/g.114460  ORF Transcript_40148/g.114460 Transcript_40148/m.114460 type:complete len:271 (+) Transcript_40148:310-1122(+)